MALDTRTIDIIAQVGLTLFSVTGIFLAARKNKWGFVVGLAGQPFWFATSIINKQWGVLVTTVGFTISWAYGAYNWFKGN